MIISASLEPSYVMRALGVRDDLAHTSIRIGLSRFTKEWEVDAAVDMIVEQVRRLRDLSPLWEMKQQGIDLSTIQWSSHYSCLLKISYASKNHGSLPPSPSYTLIHTYPFISASSLCCTTPKYNPILSQGKTIYSDYFYGYFPNQ